MKEILASDLSTMVFFSKLITSGKYKSPRDYNEIYLKILTTIKILSVAIKGQTSSIFNVISKPSTTATTRPWKFYEYKSRYGSASGSAFSAKN